MKQVYSSTNNVKGSNAEFSILFKNGDIRIRSTKKVVSAIFYLDGATFKYISTLVFEDCERYKDLVLLGKAVYSKTFAIVVFDYGEDFEFYYTPDRYKDSYVYIYSKENNLDFDNLEIECALDDVFCKYATKVESSDFKNVAVTSFINRTMYSTKDLDIQVDNSSELNSNTGVNVKKNGTLKLTRGKYYDSFVRDFKKLFESLDSVVLELTLKEARGSNNTFLFKKVAQKDIPNWLKLDYDGEILLGFKRNDGDYTLIYSVLCFAFEIQKQYSESALIDSGFELLECKDSIYALREIDLFENK